MPRSLSAFAAFWLTSWPCTQYTTTLLALGSSGAHTASCSGSRRRAPAIVSVELWYAELRLTSMTSGGVPPANADLSSDAVMDAFMFSPGEVTNCPLNQDRGASVTRIAAATKPKASVAHYDLERIEFPVTLITSRSMTVANPWSLRPHGPGKMLRGWRRRQP